MSGGTGIRRRLLPAAAVVIAHAAVQALLVAVAPRDPLSVGGVGAAIASGLGVLAAAIVLARLAAAATGAGSRPRETIVWAIVSSVVVGVCLVVLPYLAVVFVAVGAAIVAAGSPRSAGLLVRRHPVRTVLWLLATIIAVVLGVIVAALAGLLIGGVAGSATTWLFAGSVAAVFALVWSREAARSAAV